MTSLYADLHTHTTCSDGKLTIEELLEKAMFAGFTAISITDHDTMEAHRILKREGYNGSVRVIPGIEVSCYENDRDVHLLGYYMDFESPALLEREGLFRADRERRAKEIIQKLAKLNVNISYEEVCAESGSAPIGRPHIASGLVKRGFCPDTQRVFDMYLDATGPAYVAKSDFSVKEGVDLIQAAGGVAVIAHPGKTYMDPRMFLTLVASGIDGIEVYHPSQWHVTREYYRVLAEQHGLLISGGSDFHGTREYDEYNFGTFGVTEELHTAIHIKATKRKVRTSI
ncbi:MAG: PHP domain-containing protein [Ignavibacteria bacterium]|nr:PHP domain-containing protein [Ignavibacteria bacterium]